MATPALWDLVSETPHADCAVFHVKRRRLKHPRDNREGVFFAIDSSDWVLALALTRDKRLVFVRQFRVGALALSWEPPGGIIETGELPAAAAQRELAEETGYCGTGAQLLASCSPNPAIFTNTAHIVLVNDCALARPVAFDPFEELETRLFTPREAETMLRRGEIPHALAHVALYQLRLAKPELFA